MSRALVLTALLALMFTAMLATTSTAFRQSPMRADEDCSLCHNLDVEQAASIISAMNPTIKVLEVNQGPIEGLWEIVIKARGKKGLAYIDYSLEHIITGSIRKVSSKENLTALRLYELSKVDIESLPLDGAILIGDPEAIIRVVAFTDPECFTCRRLHLEMKKVVKGRDDIVFFVKLFPHDSHPGAYKKSKAIACKKSLRMLSDAFAGKKIPAPSCDTDEIDNNIVLAGELGITRPPVIILPDGAIIPEKDADTLIRLIDTAAFAAGIRPDPEEIEEVEATDEFGNPIKSDNDRF